MTSTMDPRFCPLCGKANGCGMAEGKTTCWCFETKIPKSVLARVPAEAEDRVCVCASCASGKRSPEETQSAIDALTRRR